MSDYFSGGTYKRDVKLRESERDLQALLRVARVAKMLQDDPHWAHSHELEDALKDVEHLLG